MDSQVKAYLPRLNDCHGDLSKDWFVYFSYRHPVRGKMVRFREYAGFKELHSKADRYEYGKKLCEKFKRRLRNRWNPFEDENVLYDAPDESKIISIRGKSIEAQVKDIVKKTFTGENLKTLTNYERYIKHFVDYLTAKQIERADISIISEEHAEDFLEWLTGKGLSNKTRNGHLTLLKKVFSVLLRKKKIVSNPFEFCVNKKHFSKPKEYFRDHIREVLVTDISQNDPYLMFFIELTYYLMRRKTELSKLRISNINMEQGVFVFDEAISKTGEQESVSIPQQLYLKLNKMELHRYPDDFYLLSNQKRPGPKQIGKNYFYKRWKVFRDRHGLKKYGLYNWKHTATISMIASGFDLKLIQEHGGWSDLNMVENYAKSFSLKSSPLIRQQYPDINSSTAFKLFPSLPVQPMQHSLPAQQVLAASPQ